MRVPRGQLDSRRPSLTAKFAVISALLASLLGVVLSAWLNHFIYQSNIAQAEKTAAYSMQLVINATGLSKHQEDALTPAQYAEVTKLLQSMVATGTYEGAVAWGPGGAIAYAAEPHRTGRTERPRSQVATALRGRTVSVVVGAVDSAIPDPTERTAIRDHGATLETFVPVPVAGHIAAAVEFYQQWRPVQQVIAQETWQALALVAAGLAALWVGLLRLVVGASRRLRKQAQDNWRLASYDALTGLPNRQFLYERGDRTLQKAIRQHDRAALLLLDLDRFKEVNDTLGHHSGDLLLQEMSDRLTTLLRDRDIVARLGGDEFVVFLADCDPEGPTGVAKRILDSLHTPFRLGQVTVEVDASIGIANCPQHGRGFDELLQHADTAMYAAKTSGGGFAVYNPECDEGSPNRLALQGELREALAVEDQIILHYQPIAALSSGETMGFEALARWQHPTHGLLPPAAFIPMAERTGLIQPLTDHVLSLAVERLRQWDIRGLHTTIAVNISARCLNNQLAERVENLLQNKRVDPDQLELEITESALMADPDGATSVLTRLRNLGVNVTIDDFGTGYSSLAYLKRLPVSKIKIDRSFIADVLTDEADRTIVEACLKFGATLGLEIVAEGVETPEVWRFLQTAGCDLAQGFLLAKPMPAEEVPRWMAARSGESKSANVAGCLASAGAC